ncbi:relaxase/mobilization nuclease domain-containing protein [Actinocorallia sp. A-T 12471]|uniref:relaxase/mobilization nuclease domain-containing protein n=1 Tax=Actinocorallia sp. A-T 12471 TaxID=3089813 RepID=UPI0029CB3A52|nr:hypothetical protein [Actinocorallia sp. A-T 12471]MDX6738696.1 hypothetical protein [Actinocorallia sp. A-T 12471]
MIGKITRGSNVGNLIVYLYGPGRTSVHDNPHVVAGFRTPLELEPHNENGAPDLRPLISLLRQPLAALSVKSLDQPVWQCSLRAAPEDPWLSDEQWGAIAAETLRRVGIIRDADRSGCRWIAIRHADNHVHIVATLAHEDGRTPRLWNDRLKVREACLAAEESHGLRRTAPADRTANRRATRAEDEKAARRGRKEVPRQTLRRAVTTAASGAAGPDEFFAMLADAGVLVRTRRSTRIQSEVTGYKVGLPGDITKDGQQIWFSGGRLAPELSIPKLCQRWANPIRSYPLIRPRAIRSPEQREAVCRAASQAIMQAAHRFQWSSSPEVRSDIAAATTGVLHTVAHATGNPRMSHIADVYARAGREPHGRVSPLGSYSRGLRTVSRVFAHALSRQTGDAYRRAVAWIQLFSCLAHLVERIAAHRAAQGRIAQAQAAQAAADALKQMADPTQQASRQAHPVLPGLLAVSFPAPPRASATSRKRPSPDTSPTSPARSRAAGR